MSAGSRFREISLARLAERLRTSLWFIPGVSALCAIALAHLLSYVDRAGLLGEGAWYLFGGQAEGARTLLTTIATSMMALTGVVFSITVLVLQLASNQFSPRVLSTFLDDRRTKLAMAAFLGSFVYAIVLLAKVREEAGGEGGFVPALAVFVAYASVLLSIVVFVRYIHHMAHSIRAVSVIGRVAEETRRCLLRQLDAARRLNTHADAAPPATSPDLVCINMGPGGVVSAVEFEALCDAGSRYDAVIALLWRIGDFVPHGAPLAEIWGAREGIDKLVASAVVLQDERTAQQDPAFGFRQLVDIAERALSPGVNDPTTAVQVIDQLHDLLRSMVCRRLPSPTRFVQGKLRLIVPQLDWEGYVRLAFDEVRQYGSSSIQVVQRLRGALQDLLSLAPAERAYALRRQVALLERAVRSASPEGEYWLQGGGAARGCADSVDKPPSTRRHHESAETKSRSQSAGEGPAEDVRGSAARGAGRGRHPSP